MGRKKKNPKYDAEKIMRQFMDCVVDAYVSGKNNSLSGSLRQISDQFGITLMKTRKILITAGVYRTKISDQVFMLKESGMDISEIMKFTGLSRSSVHSYLPYTKIIYNVDELSLYAERCKTYRERKKAVEKLQMFNAEVSEKKRKQLWDTIELFEGYPFMSVKGLRFRYAVNGNEIMINRKKKAITRSSVDMAVKKVIKLNGEVAGPKKLGVFGSSYLYSIFLRFGLIREEDMDEYFSDLDDTQ